MSERDRGGGYKQHGRRHARTGSDPIPGIGTDWVVAEAVIGTVTNGAAAVSAGFSAITYQTDDGSIFGVGTGGSYDTIDILVVGSYLVRIGVTFPQGRTGFVQIPGNIGGDLTAYDYDVATGGTNFTDIGPGWAWFEQLVVVNDLTSPSGVYVSFAQTTGSSMVGVTGFVQIFRLT